ncbi:hypothetical protein MY1884_006928 [Beauveria asiatica]
MACTGIATVGIEWTRRYVWEVRLSWLRLSLGLGLFILWRAHTSLTQAVGFEAIVAIGLGSLFTVLPIIIQASTKADSNGQAVGILVSFWLFGAAVGLAVSTAAFGNQFSSSVAALSDLPPALCQLLRESHALGSIPRLKGLGVSAAELVSIQTAHQQSFRAVFLILTGLSCVGSLLSYFAGEAFIKLGESGRQNFIV